MQHIVKRKGQHEIFDERKVYASCYASCLNAHRTKEDAETTCEQVSNSIRMWVADRGEVDSNDLFLRIGEEIGKHDPDAAFMYKTHRDIS